MYSSNYVSFPHSQVPLIHANVQKNKIIFLIAIYKDCFHLSKLEIYLEEVNSILPLHPT